MTRYRWRKLAWTACLLGLAGCAAQPDTRSQWTMPGAIPRGQGVDKGAAGYTWVYATRGGGSGAPNQRLPRGDLPDDSLMARDALWQVHEAQALRLAQQLNRLIVIDFYAEWCEPCVHMALETFADPELRRTLKDQFVTMQVNVTEETMANREQLSRYRVSWLPTLLIVAPNGQELDRIDHFISAADLDSRLAALSAQHDPNAALDAHVAPAD